MAFPDTVGFIKGLDKHNMPEITGCCGRAFVPLSTKAPGHVELCSYMHDFFVNSSQKQQQQQQQQQPSVATLAQVSWITSGFSAALGKSSRITARRCVVSSNSSSGAVSGGFAGRVASRACSSPPSSCFQPVLLSLRLSWFRGLAPRGLGPFPVLPLFVFVLAATLAACCAAMALEVLWEDAVFESSLETDFSGDVLVSWGVCDTFWMRETEFGETLSVHESDFELYVSEFSLWTMVEADLESMC